MNKYSILKNSESSDLLSDEFFKVCSSLKPFSPDYGISSWAMRQNFFMTKSISLPSYQNIIKSEKFSVFPKTKDFSVLLEKLDMVTCSNNVMNKEFALLENEQIECVIDEGSYYYLRIPVKGKKSPLRFYIKRLQGKVTVYVSSAHSKPTTSNYEQLFNSDTFEIRNIESIFRLDYLFLGIKGTTYSKILVSSIFGKNRVRFFDEKKIKKKENDLENFPEKDPIRPKTKKKHFSKNLIEENFTKRMLSPEQLTKKIQD